MKACKKGRLEEAAQLCQCLIEQFSYQKVDKDKIFEGFIMKFLKVSLTEN